MHGTSSLSGIDGQAPCYPAFSQVVPIRKAHRDGVNRGPPRRGTTVWVSITEESAVAIRRSTSTAPLDSCQRLSNCIDQGNLCSSTRIASRRNPSSLNGVLDSDQLSQAYHQTVALLQLAADREREDLCCRPPSS
jgi:hypothetical protein